MKSEEKRPANAAGTPDGNDKSGREGNPPAVTAAGGQFSDDTKPSLLDTRRAGD